MTASAVALARSVCTQRQIKEHLENKALLAKGGAKAGDAFHGDAPWPTERSFYHPEAPWPAMRGDGRNTGFGAGRVGALTGMPSVASSDGAPIRVWNTGNGVFSTPIIGPNETVYVGSADKNFYAFNTHDGSTLWQVRTGECIDSAACIDRDGKVYVPSCDGSVYALDARTGASVWRFDALVERVGFTPSTIYWWEANLTIGPGGLLYGGNDNFYLYALNRDDGRVAWAHPTGLNIWSAPAFDQAGHLYGASFDMHAFCLDEATGKEKWRTCVGNLVAASPALTPQGAVVVGTLGGDIVALDRASGKQRWKQHLGGHIYASAAVGPDDRLYVGSADGVMICLDARNGARMWTYDTGDAIRGSAALGPDPEKKVPYLVYFGSGNGVVYALEPDGRRRWSFDTAGDGAHTEYGNINASIALGNQGLATGSAKGDVIWIPYDAYLRLPGFERNPSDGFANAGAFLHLLSVGGTATRGAPGDVAVVSGAQTLTLRTSVRVGGQTVPARVVPESLQVTITPPLPHEVLQPDPEHVSIVPRALPLAGTVYAAVVACNLVTETGEQVQSTRTLRFTAARVDADATGLPAQISDRRMRLSHISVYEPAMVPSFDQIGLASLHMDVRVVHHNPHNHKVVAWGVLPFGTDDDGTKVGVPGERRLWFAFSGAYDQGHFALEAAQPWFEITATPVPLDRLCLTGTLPHDDGVATDGGSLVAQVQVPSLWQMCKNLVTGRASVLTRTLREARSGASKTRRALPGGFGRGMKLMLRTGKTAWRMMRGDVHKAWGLLGADGRFNGVGTFRVGAVAAPQQSGALRVTGITVDRRLKSIVAQVRGPLDGAAGLGMLAINLNDETPWPLDYNTARHCKRRKDGTTTLQLRMPKDFFRKGAPPTEVVVMNHLEVLHRARVG